MKINVDSPSEEVRIEIIPLIDVIFCILTFFILAAVSLTRQSAINVDLPAAATGRPQMREMLVVSVDPIGQTYVEQQPVTRDQLYQTLLNYQQTNPQGLMVLYASRSTSYNDVVGVLDLLRSVGGNQVALATFPDPVNPAQQPLPGLNGAPNGSLTPIDPFGLPTQPDLNSPFDPGQDLFPGLEPAPSLPSNGDNFGLPSPDNP